MWRIWRRARLLAALAAFFLLVGVIGAPQLCLLLFRTRPAVAPAATRRKAVGRWQSWWGVLAYHFCTALGGMRVTMNCPPPTLLAREKGDFIVIANHFGLFDGIFLVMVLAAAGRRDVRIVAKREVIRVPVLGRVWREMGSAFVARDRRAADGDAVEQLAAVAREDGACVLIFPEGTVYKGVPPGKGFRHLLPPRPGGFRRLVRALPGRRVLCVTFRWHDFRISGPLAEAAVTPPGHDVTVGWRLLDAPSPEEADQFLVSLWRHLDAELDQAGGHRLV